MQLNNKNVIVTGGANGIGKCLVKMLVDKGVRVGVLDNKTENLQRVKNENPQIWTKECDVSNVDQVENSINEFFKQHQKKCYLY